MMKPGEVFLQVAWKKIAPESFYKVVLDGMDDLGWSCIDMLTNRDWRLNWARHQMTLYLPQLQMMLMTE